MSHKSDVDVVISRFEERIKAVLAPCANSLLAEDINPFSVILHLFLGLNLDLNLLSNTFRLGPDQEKRFKCRICGLARKPSGNTWSNVLKHLHEKHPDWKEQVQQLKNGGTLDKYVDQKESNLPFSFVDQQVNRKYSNLKPICNKTLKDALHALTKKVEDIITHMLPSKFALIFDGWDGGDTHFVAIYASFMYDGSRKQVLLSFSPCLDETSQTADEHFKLLQSALEYYKKSLENVFALIGDNCATNKRLANLCGIPLVGCFSHILNLAVKKFYFEVPGRKQLISKVATLMGTLKTKKGAAFLRRYADVKAIGKNETRWTSTYDMLIRYIRLLPSMSDITEEYITEQFLNRCENAQIESMLVELEQINKSMKYLQDNNLILREARDVFDILMKKFVDMSDDYLSPDAKIIHNPAFTHAVIKIQRGQSSQLTREEKLAVKSLRKVEEAADTTTTLTPDEELVNFFAEKGSSENKKRKVCAASDYIDLGFIIPTSNCVERLFSVAKYVYSPHRQRLLPLNLEAILFLKANRSLWDLNVTCEALAGAKGTVCLRLTVQK